MKISRERYLDDTTHLHLELSLQTRTPEMHSRLSDAPVDVQARVGELLVEALDRIQATLKPVASRPPAAAATSDFGCGT